MGVHNPMDLSLGEWTAIVKGWNKAHQKTPDPPTMAEFEQAVAASRSIH